PRRSCIAAGRRARSMPKRDESAGRFAYAGLDRVMHERARLSLLTSLAAHQKGLAFADLKRLCGLTDGNLSRHLRILEEAGLVEIAKAFPDNRPPTTCRLTSTRRPRVPPYPAGLGGVGWAGPRAARAARAAAPGPRPAPP